MVEYRSYSQYNTMEQCAYRYQLERLDKAWQRPAAWLPMGTAVHEAGEAYEKSMREMPLEEAQEVFRDAYTRETNKLLEETPNMDFWFASGPYKGEADIERRYQLGLEHVERYLGYYEEYPDQLIWIDPTTGEPAIELEFDIDLDGVRVRGFIDAVIFDAFTGEVFPRDTKTGNKPGNGFQLKTYGEAVQERTVVPITSGDYFMTKSGKPTVKYDLTGKNRDDLVSEYQRIDAQIRAGDFPPNPEESRCRVCSVQLACEFWV